MAFMRLDPSIVSTMSTFLHSHTPLLCVSKDSARGVEAFKEELMRKFHDAEFQVEWLGVRVGGNLQMRVTRKLDRVFRGFRLGAGDREDIVRWWYGTSVALEIFCARYNFPASFLQGASFHAVLRECYEHSEMRQYDFGSFKDFWRRQTTVNIDAIIPRGIWYNEVYVNARDISCPYLGKSVREVLGTLICAIEREEYCYAHCEQCRLEREQIRGECRLEEEQWRLEREQVSRSDSD